MEQKIVTIRAQVTAQTEEKRSRFVATLTPVTTKEEAQAVVKEISAANRDARHNCYCWRLADGTERSSDNGEPSGTAGIPMLQVLQKAKLTDVCLVITRYFGGILLGAPGLVRVYSKAASLAVEAADPVIYRICDKLTIHCPYPLYDRVNYLLPDFALTVEDTAFSDAVTLKITVRQDETTRLKEALAFVGNGQIRIDHQGQTLAAL